MGSKELWKAYSEDRITYEIFTWNHQFVFGVNLQYEPGDISHCGKIKQKWDW